MQRCTHETLNNIGPGRLMNLLSNIHYMNQHGRDPEFVCQKIVAYVGKRNKKKKLFILPFNRSRSRKVLLMRRPLVFHYHSL